MFYYPVSADVTSGTLGFYAVHSFSALSSLSCSCTALSTRLSSIVAGLATPIIIAGL